MNCVWCPLSFLCLHFKANQLRHTDLRSFYSSAASDTPGLADNLDIQTGVCSLPNDLFRNSLSDET